MSTHDFQDQAPALTPVRGLVLCCNRRGDATDLTALRQWLRLCGERFACQKVDCWEPDGNPARILPLLEEAAHLGLRLSLYTDLSTSPDGLQALVDAGLLDVHLRANAADLDALERWVEACEAAGISLRLSLFLGALESPLPPERARVLMRAAVVTLYLDEWLVPYRRATLPSSCLEHATALAESLSDGGPEVHFADVPFCQVSPALWGVVSNRPQRLAYHQHLHPDAEAFARDLAGLSPARMQQAIEIELGHGASFHNPIDRAVLPWILEKPRGLFWIWFLHKLTRRLFLRRPKPQPLPEDTSYLEHRLARHRADHARTLGPACVTCRLNPICDHMTEVFKDAFPGKTAAAETGDACYDPLAFRTGATTFYDVVDSARHALPEHERELAHAARRITAERTPDREIAAESYAIEDHATDRMPASVRWFSFSTQTLRSTSLARVSPPVTLSATFGGGIAERIGFCVGRHAWLLCPMTAFRHKITLHVDGDGHYVLLRDGVLVAPCGFTDRDAVPERLGSTLEPRLAAVNIDGQLVTQTVLVWEGQASEVASAARHSVVVVCTRFARRLEAALRALGHQASLEGGALEVIVGYVPGIDATDDVLDSMEVCYPHVSLKRMPFPADRQRAKGLMINECAAIASGDWITLLDADIILPPDYFSQLDGLAGEIMYAAPEGRYMLDAATTASILFGEVAPWRDYATLQKGAPEYRHEESDGMPPGFCQSVRRGVFEEIRYAELDHFEGADWLFSKCMVERYGKETRLEGVGVLHLDHGGSQWYGTEKHR